MGSVLGEQFKIRWRNYSGVLQGVARELLAEQQMVDVTLCCEGASVRCHRLVLTACSPYFHKLFLQFPPSASNLVVFLKDVKGWQLEALVHFMYHGEVSVKQHRLAPLVRAAESLKIRGLSSDDQEDDDEDEEEDENVPEEEPVYEQRPNPQRTPVPGRSLLRLRNSWAEVKRSVTTNGTASGPPKLLKMEPPKEEEEEEEEPHSTLEQLPNEMERAESAASSSDELEDGSQNAVNKKVAPKYEKEVKESALAALQSGVSLRQCSEAFGVPRKTLSKWRQRESQTSQAQTSSDSTPHEETSDTLNNGEVTENASRPEFTTNPSPVITDPPMTEPVLDAADRANRLRKATSLALSGITVRQAAAHYGIPRTTLCAYMKRRGLAGKRIQGANTASRRPSYSGSAAQRRASNQGDGFLFGLSELVSELSYEDNPEENEQHTLEEGLDEPGPSVQDEISQ